MSTLSEVVLLTENVGQVQLDSTQTPRPGCLGRLTGVIADFKNPTRNNRMYGLELWKKVFSTDWVIEALETLTLYGEADHPLDRLETKMSEAAVVLIDYNIDEDKGIINGTFDILDTPNGRIIKALSDYGSKLGVSSRGQGSVQESAQGQVVNPSSYVFAGFDVVILPAVKVARQDYTNESLNSLRAPGQIIKEEIESTSSTSDLLKIRSLLESSNLPIKDELESNIESKLQKLKNEDTDTISNVVYEDLDEAYSKIDYLTNKLNLIESNTISFEAHKEVLDELRVTRRKLIKSSSESSRLKEQLESVSDKATELLESHSSVDNSELLSTYKDEIDRLNSLLESKDIDKKKQLTRIKRRTELQVTELYEQIDRVRKELSTKDLENIKLSEEVNKLSLDNKVLTESLAKSPKVRTRVREVPKEVKVDRVVDNPSHIKLIERLESTKNRLTKRVSSYERDLKKERQDKNVALNEYAKLLCRSEGVPYSDTLFESVNSPEDVSRTVEGLVSSRSRINSIPVSLNSDMGNASFRLDESSSISNKKSEEVDPEQVARLARLMSGM